MKKIDGNRKITLTLGQLKRLVRESASDASDFNIDNGWLRAYYGEGGDVVIPNNVMVICFSVFAKCGKLTSVIIPGSVKSIDEGAFKFCTNLTNVKIGNGVKNIGDDVFWDCKNLKSVTIPDSVTRIGSCAFAGCENLTSITIGTGVTKIGFGVFLKCKNLKTIYVSNEEQKDMIINKSDYSPQTTKIIVKGEDSDDSDFIVEDTDNVSGSSVTVLFRTMEHIDDHAGKVVFPSINALVEFLNAIGAEYTEEIADGVVKGKMMPIELPSPIVQLGVELSNS